MNEFETTEISEKDEKSLLSKIKPSNIFLPILIGLGVVAYMMYSEINVELLSMIKFSLKSFLMLVISILFMVGRDFGYMWRLRILSSKELSWLQVFRVIMLWEFTSAVTPSAVGGTSVAVVYVHKEGLSVGRSTSIVMLTSFFDELYFIIMFPITLAILGYSNLFDINLDDMSVIGTSIMAIAIVGYILKLIFLITVSYGLFINPVGLKRLLVLIFKLPILHKKKRSAIKAGNDIILSSQEIKSRNVSFWLKAFFATFISWSSRYLVVNAIILAFFSFSDHFLLFARQLVMWIMMLIMPTPGGSGFSEYLFKEYLGGFIPVSSQYQLGIAALLALIWRVITYYPYLIIGAVIFPKWVKTKFLS